MQGEDEGVVLLLLGRRDGRDSKDERKEADFSMMGMKMGGTTNLGSEILDGSEPRRQCTSLHCVDGENNGRVGARGPKRPDVELCGTAGGRTGCWVG
jgi:hypothetical protein